MEKLTERQAEILQFIEQQVQDRGYPPTMEEIVQAFGFASRNAARDHLQALARKGYVELARNSARGIRVLANAYGGSPRQFELPLIGRIAAGSPITAAENVETWFRIDPSLFSPRADFLHLVSGESMINAGIEDGDFVGIHAQSTADSGQIIAAAIPDDKTGEERITLKRYLRRGNTVVLKAENSSPKYAPIEIKLGGRNEDSQARQRFRIAGVYAGLLRLPRR